MLVFIKSPTTKFSHSHFISKFSFSRVEESGMKTLHSCYQKEHCTITWRQDFFALAEVAKMS